mgnify:CR=1 FL=1
MGRLFGTDGARGVAITELTCELAMQIGRAAAMVLTKETNHKAKIIIGKDTRISGDILESALVAGICSVGADAHILGVVPTPAVAMLVKKYNADAGVMISASHNSVEFNGIKLFSGTGFKLSDEIENEIEALILDTPEKIELKDGCDIGHVYYEKDAAWDYIRYVMKTVQTDFNGIRVALDCANGSASVCAQRIFEGLGAKCIMLNDKPDGTNINKDCGSTHIEGLQKAVVDNHCDIGLAFDGDADRCLAVDEKGELIDGDKILAIFSKYMKSMGILKNNTCVVTVMTNLGFFKYAKANGIVAATTKVGDRYVLEEMLKGGYNIGGEQSGHIIFLDENTTGDGLLSALHLLQVMVDTGKPLSELSKIMTVLPQALVGAKVPNHKKDSYMEYTEIAEAIARVSAKFEGEGRVLIRPSGTEPLVRVMIEGKDQEMIEKEAKSLAELIQNVML